MKKYEYHSIIEKEITDEKLNELGENGWKLVSTIKTKRFGSFESVKWIFVREKK